jgi:hypothetical protein
MTHQISDPAASAPDTRPTWLRMATRHNVASGLMFIMVGGIGLWVSRNYPIGTAVRMGTGYVPRLMCWILLALGALVLVMGIRGGDAAERDPPLLWQPLLFIPLSLVVFALGMDGLSIRGTGIEISSLGFVISGLMMIAVAGMAFVESRVIEVVISAVALVFFTWAIFVYALGLTIPVWPGS